MAKENKRKDNTGAIFRSDPKWIEDGGEKERPAYTGRVRIGGKDYRLAGWVKSHDDVVGGSYISLALASLEGNDDAPEPF